MLGNWANLRATCSTCLQHTDGQRDAEERHAKTILGVHGMPCANRAVWPALYHKGSCFVCCTMSCLLSQHGNHAAGRRGHGCRLEFSLVDDREGVASRDAVELAVLDLAAPGHKGGAGRRDGVERGKGESRGHGGLLTDLVRLEGALPDADEDAVRVTGFHLHVVAGLRWSPIGSIGSIGAWGREKERERESERET